MVVHAENDDTIRIISARRVTPASARTTKTMRDQYDLKNGRPNPHASKLGKKDRTALVEWWTLDAASKGVLLEQMESAV